MKVLVVDDNRDVISSIREVLPEDTVLGANSSSEVKRILTELSSKNLSETDVDVAIIDVVLKNESGIDILKYLKENYPRIECVMISGYSSIGKAVESIKLGAFDFLEKPISYQKLKVTLKNALERKKYSRLLEQEKNRYTLIGNSTATKKINQLIKMASKTDLPVLIQGESGTGKENVAHLIHLTSKRFTNEIVELNCASIPETLFESELFGYERGAFTGATTTKIGKVEQANGGTLFLDEIGELPLSQQAKLLRVLETKTFTRLGGAKKITTDFRLICATNRNLDEMVKRGNFREDLFFRIGVILIEIPPLRERKEDIEPIANHFLTEIAKSENCEVTLTEDAIEFLKSIPLRGNARELKNIVQRAFVLSNVGQNKHEITKECLEAILSPSILPPNREIFSDESNSSKPDTTIPDDISKIFKKTMPISEAKRILEKKYIETQLKLHGGNISRTAIALGILPGNLMRKMKTLGIK